MKELLSNDKGVNVYYPPEKCKELGIGTRSKKESRALRKMGQAFAALVSKCSKTTDVQ